MYFLIGVVVYLIYVFILGVVLKEEDFVSQYGTLPDAVIYLMFGLVLIIIYPAAIVGAVLYLTLIYINKLARTFNSKNKEKR
jgi:hypothetical protein